MYRYNNKDIRFVRERVQEFRGQVLRRLSGELPEAEFRPLRLMNGLYLQRHAYMLRVSIPYGLVNSAQVRKLAFIAERYDRGFAHVTTRQNLQFNWLKLEDVPDILGHLADVEMHAIQTSGNCVRNISADPRAGIAHDEILDVRPYCELLRQYKELHPEFMYLPRKFKLAFSGSREDRAATMVHDIGVRAVEREDGTIGWRVYVGGGLGRTPRVGQIISDFLPLEHIIGYTEAILRVYNLHGRRDNKYKARIKILVGEMGIESFREQVEAEWALVPEPQRSVDHARIAEIADMFDDVVYDKAAAANTSHMARRGGDPAFDRWLTQNVKPHAQPGYNVVYLSMKHRGRPPGDVATHQMYAIADLMDTYSAGYCAFTYQQNALFQYVRNEDLGPLYDSLYALGLATPNIGTLQDIICCPGLDYCNLANSRSIPLSLAITERFADLDEVYDLGPVEIKISGCINA
ncbi:MAG: sulfite reductase (NADPH) hemoprotein beta-component, partial [Myxococcota bacterium]